MLHVGGAYKRAMGAFAFAFSSLGLSGCGALTNVFSELRDTAAAKPAFTDDLGDRPFNLATDCMPAAQNDKRQCVLPVLPGDASTAGENSTYRRISSLAEPVDQIVWRNRFQDFLIWRSEKQCQVYKSSIIATQNGVNFGLNTLTTGAAGVAAIVIAPAANILGGIAAISNGVRGHFNEDFYQRFVAPAIINQVDKQRSDQLAKIMLKRGTAVDSRPAVATEMDPKKADAVLRAVPMLPAKLVLTQDYTLEESIGDAERYHQLCSATIALAALLKDDVRFQDTSTGIKARLNELYVQLKTNTDQIKTLSDLNVAPTGSTARPYDGAIGQLTDANNEIAKQIAILQRQMLTAPPSR